MPRAHRWRTKQPSAADAARKAKYNAAPHQAARRAAKEAVAAGIARCWRCGNRLRPGHWHMGHDDDQPDQLRGPECDTCNRSAGARKAGAIAAARKAQALARQTFTRPDR